MEEMRVSLYRGRCLAVEIEVLHVTLETFTKLFLHFFEAKRTSKKNCKNLFLQTDIPLEKLPSTKLFHILICLAYLSLVGSVLCRISDLYFSFCLPSLLCSRNLLSDLVSFLNSHIDLAFYIFPLHRLSLLVTSIFLEKRTHSALHHLSPSTAFEDCENSSDFIRYHRYSYLLI